MIQEAVLGEKRVSRINGKAIRRSKLEAHYQALLHRIRAVDARSECVKSIGVISCAPGAGVSTVSFNLAVAVAHADCGPVLFVDADVTKRANERRIAASPAIGLADALTDAADPMDCVFNSSTENLSIVPGRGKANPGELTADPFKICEILNAYKKHFQLLVIDIPAATELNSSVCLAGELDGVILVIEAEKANARAALRTKQQLVDVNANLLGVVLNKPRKYVPNWIDRML